MALLRRFWVAGRGRLPSTAVDAFRLADRYRRAGRFADATALVAHGLALEPNNVTGHLLAAYLHVAHRAMTAAKREYCWVLARDPHHARALLGLARIALEEGEVDTCRDLLIRALRLYPDYPEAQALLDALTTPPVTAPPPPPLRVDRLRLPGAGRALLLARADGSALATQPAVEDDAAAAHAAQALRLAAATLARAGFGELRRGMVEDDSRAVFLRTDGDLILGLTLPRTIEISQGLLDINRLWGAVLHELGLAASAAMESAAPAIGPAREPARASNRRAS